MGIEVTITEEGAEEITPMRQLSVLILALRDCLALFTDDERQRMIAALPDLILNPE